jgi:UDP-N-acetylmuramyl pentapeptide synthase
METMRVAQLAEHSFSEPSSQGASAAVASYPSRATNSPSALSLLQVQDTLTSLHKLATSYRRLMPPTAVARGDACI